MNEFKIGNVNFDALVNSEITSGLVGWFKFKEGTGTTTADSSGNGNNGTLINSPTWTTSNTGNGALNLSSAGLQRVDIGSGSSLNVTQITISAWVKVASGQTAMIVCKNYDGNSLPYSLYVGTNGGGGAYNGLSSYTNAAAWKSTNVVTDARDNTWHFICGTYDGLTFRYFIDSVQNATFVATGVLPTNAENVSVGCYQIDNVYFNGLIADVRIYNRALTGTEIKTLFNNGAK